MVNDLRLAVSYFLFFINFAIVGVAGMQFLPTRAQSVIVAICGHCATFNFSRMARRHDGSLAFFFELNGRVRVGLDELANVGLAA
jgi:hypothetical protein